VDFHIRFPLTVGYQIKFSNITSKEKIKRVICDTLMEKNNTTSNFAAQ